jgi:hypothetical protein
LEKTSSLGGMATQGLVPCWAPFSDKTKIVYTGIAEELFSLTKKGMPHVAEGEVDWVAIDAERLKRILDQKLEEAKVDVFFNTVIVSVGVEDAGASKKRISYVVAAHKGLLRAYGGKTFIDCSGDSDIVSLAGLPFRVGDEETGEIQPMTQCFVLSNVSEYYYEHMPLLHMGNPTSASYDIARSEKYPLVIDAHCVHKLLGPGTVGFNAGHLWDVDPSDPKSSSKALARGRELAYEFYEGLREFLPRVFSASHLVQVAEMFGVRDSRRVIGEYTITLDDYFKRRSFPDDIGRNSYFLDRHLTRRQNDRVMAGAANGEEEFEAYQPGESHGIPYRALVVRDAENLLAAGRNISCEHRPQGSIRTIPICMVMGQAAGIAAAITQQGTALRDLDIKALQAELERDGVNFKPGR